jgi:hypothetical protein
MFVLAIAAAAVLSGAVIENQEVQNTIAGLPVIRSQTGGGVELTVDPAGNVLSCAPITTLGGPEVAAALCDRLDGARLRPARAADGNTTLGLVRVFAQGQPSGSGHETWSIGLRPEIELLVPTRPRALPSDGVVVLHAAVDASGRVGDCRVADEALQSLESAACDGLRSVDFGALRGANAGAPFVTTTAVRFVPQG